MLRKQREQFIEILFFTEEIVKYTADQSQNIVTEHPVADLLDSLPSDKRELDGADLRQLRSLLEKLDPNQTWGGLTLAPTPEGHYFWLCPHHAEEFRKGAKPKLAPQPPLLLEASEGA